MAATKKKPRAPRVREAPSQNGPPENAAADTVFTLAEAAAYLRLPESEVTRLVRAQDLPGRLAGTEWRFLKSAIQAWLSTPALAERGAGVWAMTGSWKDDPDLDEMLADIYRRRGRPMTEGN